MTINKGDVIIDDFIESIDSIKEFVSQFNRKMGDTQKVMILRRQVEHLKNNINAMIGYYSGNLSKRGKIIAESISSIQSLLNKIPATADYELIWLNLRSYQAILITALASPQGVSSITQLQGQANLLSHLLLEIDRIHDFPAVEGEWTKEQFDIRRASFNAIQITTVLFVSACTNIYHLSTTTMIKWVNEAFWHIHLLIEYHKTIDYHLLWQQNNQDYEEFYRKAWASFLPLSNIPAFILLNYQLWGDVWPDDISSQDLIQDTSIQGIIRTIEELKEYYIDRKEDLVALFEKGKVDRNAVPENFRFFRFIEVTELNITRIEMTIRAFSSYNRVESITEILTAQKLNLHYLQAVIEAGGGATEFLKTPFGQTFSVTLPTYLALSAQISVLSKDSQIYTSSVNEIQVFFDLSDLEDHKAAYYTDILCRLYIHGNLETEIDLDIILSTINQLVPLCNHLPRLKLSLQQMQILLELSTGITTQSSATEAIKGLSQVIEELGLYHLQPFINHLSNQISEVECNGISINELDFHSWLRPTFSFGKNKSVTFVPLYLQRNRIFQP